MKPKISFVHLAISVFSLIAFCECEVDMDAVIHFRTKHGDTLLHAAVKSRRTSALQAFLELGCPVAALDREGRTALWLATEEGEVDHMRLLAKYGADLTLRYGEFNETLLHVAAKNGRDLALFWLLEAGLGTEARDGAGWTALHGAAAYGYGTTARLLVARGADVGAADLAGETPLHKAVRVGRAGVVGLLLELGAAVGAEDAAGRTPLQLAQRFGFRRIVSLLEARAAGTLHHTHTLSPPPKSISILSK